MTNANIMRMSELYVPTLKEDPTDAEIASHKLLLRAGMIRKTASGVYTFLPLGKRVLAKVERIANLGKPLKVAVMGCVVNGPGEAADADIGVACGAGMGVVFSKGDVVRKVEESAIVDALMEEIGKL